METVLKLASARERMLLSASEHGYKTPTTASISDDHANALVAELFGMTLHSNDQAVGAGGQTVNNGNALGDNPVNPEPVVTLKQPNLGRKGKTGTPQEPPLPQNPLSQVSQGQLLCNGTCSRILSEWSRW